MSCKIKYNTGNPLCSSDPRDLSDNAQIIDSYVNSTELTQDDRFGMTRKTWAGIEKEAQDQIDSLEPKMEQLIDDKIVAQGGVELANEWGDSLDKVLSQGFITNNVGDYLEISGKTVEPTGSGSGLGSYHAFGKMPVTLGKTGGYVAIGSGVLANSTTAGGVVAIGDGVFNKGANPRLSEAIGMFSQHHSSSNRNTSLGSLSLFGLSTGTMNVAVGRDAGQNLTTGSHNTFVGYGANAGASWMGFDNTIRTNYEFTGNSNTCVGRGSGSNLSMDASNNTLVGRSAGYSSKNLANTVVVGVDALFNVDSNKSVRGFPAKSVSITSDYTYDGNGNITVSASALSEVPLNGMVYASFQGGLLDVNSDRKPLLLKSRSGDSHVFTKLIDQDVLPTTASSGSMTVSFIETSLTASPVSHYSVVLGFNALKDVTASQYDTVIGGQACQTASTIATSTVMGGLAHVNTTEVDRSVSVGYRAGANSTSVKSSVLVGWGASSVRTVIIDSVSIGFNASSGTTSGVDVLSASVNIGFASGWGINGSSATRNTTVGYYAGNATLPANTINSTMLGSRSTVTGSNQVQLGDADTQTYVYGTVQNRSDIRDKRDVKELELGLDFVMKLKPKQFKWDYREWQGKKSGKRDHVGFIAQELQETLKDTNYAFVQDHKVNGGSDVLSVGYDEFIGVLTKAIQEQQQQINLLQIKVSELRQDISRGGSGK